jgi:phage-related protein
MIIVKPPPAVKPVIWMGSSRRDVSAFPDQVRSHVGYALYVAQQGGKHQDAKPLKGFKGASVVEVVTHHRGDTFRTVYTVRIAGIVYVLDAFQKKSKKGSETSKADLDRIRKRLSDAEKLAKGEKQ